MQRSNTNISRALQQHVQAETLTVQPSGGSAARTTTATTISALSLMAWNTLAPRASAVVSLQRSAFIKICYREYFKMKG